MCWVAIASRHACHQDLPGRRMEMELQITVGNRVSADEMLAAGGGLLPVLRQEQRRAHHFGRRVGTFERRRRVVITLRWS